MRAAYIAGAGGGVWKSAAITIAPRRASVQAAKGTWSMLVVTTGVPPSGQFGARVPFAASRVA